METGVEYNKQRLHIQGLHASLSVTFEEGTSAAWLHDLLNLTSPISWPAIRARTPC
jgi:hypothetical protein